MQLAFALRLCAWHEAAASSNVSSWDQFSEQLLSRWRLVLTGYLPLTSVPSAILRCVLRCFSDPSSNEKGVHLAVLDWRDVSQQLSIFLRISHRPLPDENGIPSPWLESFKLKPESKYKIKTKWKASFAEERHLDEARG